MSVQELMLNNQTVDGAILPVEEKPETDKSELLFNYMNMIAFNNKVDLKLN